MRAREEECEAMTGALEVAHGVVERFVGDVRDVDHHAEAVHFQDDLFAEISEAVVRRRVGGGIGPLGVAHVREGHVANAESSVGAKHGEVVVDHVATFDAHKRGDFALLLGGADFVGGGGEDEIIGMLADGFADCVDLVDGFLDGFGTDGFAGDPDGEEDGVEATFAHARDVDVAVGVARADVEGGIEKTLRGVIVSVDDDGGGVEFFCFVGNGLRVSGSGHKRKTE